MPQWHPEGDKPIKWLPDLSHAVPDVESPKDETPAMSTESLLLDYPSAAAALSMSRAALRDLVYRNKGPAIVKVGSRTFFTPDDLKVWIARHRMPANDPRPKIPAATVEAVMAPGKRKKGRPTKAEQLARAQHFETRA